jgi:hypothetical protein
MNMLAFAIVGHMVGDYLLQNDWMAQGKKRSNFVCAIHASIWTAAVATFAHWWAWPIVAILFTSHFAQDRGAFVVWWMKLIGQKNFMQPPLGPWSIIICDNTWHLVVLALIAYSHSP